MSDGHVPARQDGRVPLRNTYRIELALDRARSQQPRRYFDQNALEELAASIQARGIKQPLTVRWEPDTRQIPHHRRRAPLPGRRHRAA